MLLLKKRIELYGDLVFRSIHLQNECIPIVSGTFQFFL